VELKGKKRRRRDLAKELKRVVWCVCVRDREQLLLLLSMEWGRHGHGCTRVAVAPAEG
jgi:hypothetical protein